MHFVGRLATYRYYNMDQVVAQALTTARAILAPAPGSGAETLAEREPALEEGVALAGAAAPETVQGPSQPPPRAPPVEGVVPGNGRGR